MNQFEPEYLKDIANSIQRLNDKFQPIANAIQQSQNKIKRAFGNNPNFLKGLHRLIENLENLPDRQKESWELAAKQGWYLNGSTPISAVSAVGDASTLDSFMLCHLEEDFEEITNEIIASCPDRREILECAFKLHLEENHIASIPLFLAQTDGICAEALGAHLFTDKDLRKKKVFELQNGQDSFTSILTGLLTLNTQLTSGMRNSSESEKVLAPNRHGIMHGSRKHLDYGTEINSYKALSLLAFVAFVFFDRCEENA